MAIISLIKFSGLLASAIQIDFCVQTEWVKELNTEKKIIYLFTVFFAIRFFNFTIQRMWTVCLFFFSFSILILWIPCLFFLDYILCFFNHINAKARIIACAVKHSHKSLLEKILTNRCKHFVFWVNRRTNNKKSFDRWNVVYQNKMMMIKVLADINSISPNAIHWKQISNRIS